MRIFIIAAFVLFVSFAAPATALALTSDYGACTVGPDCISGYCYSDEFTSGTGICYPNPSGISGGGDTGISGGGSSGVALINPLNSGTSVESFLQSILAFVIRIGAVVVTLMVVYVGFKFVTAQGNESKISEAKTMLLWTVIGALVLLGAQAIATGIKATVQSLGG